MDKNIKTMRIGIDLTSDEYAKLREIASLYDTNVNGLLSQFIADLTVSDRSGGSDERYLASDWLSRSSYNFPIVGNVGDDE